MDPRWNPAGLSDVKWEGKRYQVLSLPALFLSQREGLCVFGIELENSKALAPRHPDHGEPGLASPWCK